MPSTVGDLRAYSVEIRCKRCGRVVPIDIARLTTAGGRSIERHLPLPRFLAKLTCTARACGEKPIHLHISIRAPAMAPSDKPGDLLRWVMDLRGQWTFLGSDASEDRG
jgi:hypothetical protein